MDSFIDNLADSFMNASYFLDSTSTWFICALIIGVPIALAIYSSLAKTNPGGTIGGSRGIGIGICVLGGLAAGTAISKVVLFLLSCLFAICSGMVYLICGAIMIFIFLVISGVIVFVI